MLKKNKMPSIVGLALAITIGIWEVSLGRAICL